MLKREIKYTDFNDEEHVDVFYFNWTKPEIMAMQVQVEGGFGQFLQNIVETKNNKELVARFQEIILSAYGEKSEDGKRFIKSDEISKQFSQTAAYEVLYMELLENETAAAEFIAALVPKDMLEPKDQDKPTTVPVSDNVV